MIFYSDVFIQKSIFIGMKIFLCDLTYNTNRVAAESYPLNVAFIASYCLKKFGSKVDITLFKYHKDLEKAIEIAVGLAELDEYRLISLPKKKDPFSEFATKFASGSNISNILLDKIGVRTELTKPIENILSRDKVQARLPFTIELK